MNVDTAGSVYPQIDVPNDRCFLEAQRQDNAWTESLHVGGLRRTVEGGTLNCSFATGIVGGRRGGESVLALRAFVSMNRMLPSLLKSAARNIAVTFALLLFAPLNSVAGETWTKVPTATYFLNNKQDALEFGNEKIGWYGNGTGAVYGTTDGGNTWKSIWSAVARMYVRLISPTIR